MFELLIPGIPAILLGRAFFNRTISSLHIAAMDTWVLIHPSSGGWTFLLPISGQSDKKTHPLKVSLKDDFPMKMVQNAGFRMTSLTSSLYFDQTYSFILSTMMTNRPSTHRCIWQPQQDADCRKGPERPQRAEGRPGAAVYLMSHLGFSASKKNNPASISSPCNMT